MYAAPLIAPASPCRPLRVTPPNSFASVRSMGRKIYCNIAAGDRRPEVYLHLMSRELEAGQEDVPGYIYEIATTFFGGVRTDSHYWEQAVANVLIDRGKFARASIHFRKALQEKPDCALCLFNLGNCYLALNEFNDAIVCYESALALRQELSPARLNVGVVCLLLSRKEGLGRDSAWAARAIEAFQSVQSSTHKLMAQFNELLALVENNLKIDEPDEVWRFYKYLRSQIGNVVTEENIDKVDITEIRRELTSRSLAFQGRFRLARRKQ